MVGEEGRATKKVKHKVVDEESEVANMSFRGRLVFGASKGEFEDVVIKDKGELKLEEN